MIPFSKINTEEAPRAIGPYSQAIRAGNLLFVSGQLPINPATGKLIGSAIDQQINQVLDNLEAILKAAGSSFEWVIRTEIFLLDLENFTVVNAEYSKRFKTSVPPTRQTVQIARLPCDAGIEISCIAALPH